MPVADGLDQQTSFRIARSNRRARVSAPDDRFARVEPQTAAFGVCVAGVAVARKQRPDFGFKELRLAIGGGKPRRPEAKANKNSCNSHSKNGSAELMLPLTISIILRAMDSQLRQLPLEPFSRIERVQVIALPLLVRDQTAFLEPNNHNRVGGSPGLEDNDFGIRTRHSLRLRAKIRHRKNPPPRTMPNRLPRPARHDFVESQHGKQIQVPMNKGQQSNCYTVT